MSECRQAFRWLRGLKKTYQPVGGTREKIDPERTQGFERIRDIMLSHMGEVEGKLILDIGSNLGWFCFEYAKLGARTIGVELNENRVRVCNCLKERDGFSEENPMFFSGDSVEWVLSRDYDYDWVILLNVFHHILLANEKDGWEMFDKLINNSRGVFVMMRNSLQTWRLCSTARNIPDAVLLQSAATDYKAYDQVHGRTIYVFWKE